MTTWPCALTVGLLGGAVGPALTRLGPFPTSGRRTIGGAAVGAGLGLALALRFGWSWSLLPLGALLAALVVLADWDIDRLLLPRRLVWPGVGAVALGEVVAAVATGAGHRPAVSAGCALGAAGLLAIVWAVRPGWLGFGDVRLGLLVGLGVGWLGVPSVLATLIATNLLGLVVAVAGLATGRMHRDTPLPYGAFLAAGAALVVLAGPAVIG